MSMILSKVLSKYQITLPKEVVAALHIGRGDVLKCEIHNGKVLFSPVIVEEAYSEADFKKFDELYNRPQNRGKVYGSKEEALKHLKRLR